MTRCVVTGAFGYSGKYITQRLLAQGHTVQTLTASPQRAHPFGSQVEAFPFHFDDPRALETSLQGAEVLINTYWVRFDHDSVTHDLAVRNTRTLFEAARDAGVGRVVHVSITNPSEDSPLPYFAGKARLERALAETGLSHSILRPAVLFGRGDILINNIAWALRRLPVFGVFGKGEYRLQPMHVDDFADLAVAESLESGNRIVDAIGPETFTSRELVAALGEIIGKPRPIVGVPVWMGRCFSWMLGHWVGDVMLTREEIDGLMADLLVTDSPPSGSTVLSQWAKEHAATLGVSYASELARRRNRTQEYDKLSSTPAGLEH